MTSLALFHSVLGVRPGVLAAADLLRSHGYAVTVVDQYDGRVFDDYEHADAYAQSVGYETLMKSAAAAASEIDPPFVVAGFSNGGGMSEYVAATTSGVVGALLFSGAIDPSMIGIDRWPGGVPVQIHYAVDDPFRNQEWIDAVERLVRASGAAVHLWDYPGRGHLFTDQSLPGEYSAGASRLLWERALMFLRQIG